ncbi:helix-turn-helix domain-containing protein [Humidisolicoccus flavus]|uniref:helix-turn-helix domain-containing protein n=1 Tax=Humidisolicoccus flavus TaxID=3111414 RepID=UPI0032516E10
MESIGARVGAAVRRERTASGLSVSELARRAGVSKATVSQLESGAGNPSVETLWSLGHALGVTFAQLVEEPSQTLSVVRAAQATGFASTQGTYVAALLAVCPPNARRDIYFVQAEPGQAKLSEAHFRGTVEHLILVSGAARVGPPEAPIALAPGDYVSYPGDVEHVFEALEPKTSAVLVSEIR